MRAGSAVGITSRHRPVRRQHNHQLVGAPRPGALPEAQTLTITADSGGSNNPRTRLWRYELQRLADTTGLRIRVCHFPPGTSKWNKIEHRMFSFVSLNWRGKPLESLEIIVNLIAAHEDEHRAEALRPPRSRQLRARRRGNRRTTRRREYHPAYVPRRLELHHQPFSNSVVSP